MEVNVHGVVGAVDRTHNSVVVGARGHGYICSAGREREDVGAIGLAVVGLAGAREVEACFGRTFEAVCCMTVGLVEVCSGRNRMVGCRRGVDLGVDQDVGLRFVAAVAAAAARRTIARPGEDASVMMILYVDEYVYLFRLGMTGRCC